jgi:large subunit ribosomal protein L9
MTVELIKKVGMNGRLFGAVTSQEISKELEKLGVSVERRLLTVDGSIKSLGTYDVKAKLFNDVTATFKLKIAIDAVMAAQLKKEQEEAQKRNAEKKAKAEALKAAAAAEAEAAANAE